MRSLDTVDYAREPWVPAVCVPDDPRLVEQAAVENDPPVSCVESPRAVFLGFCVYTFVLIARPQDYLPALVPYRLVLTSTVLMVALTSFWRGSGPPLMRDAQTRLYLVLFGVMCAGIPFSIYRRISFENVIAEYVVNVLYYLLFVIHVNTAARYRHIVVVLMLAGLAFSAFGLYHGAFDAGRFFTGSEMFDPNDVAFVEVSLLSFAACVALGSFHRMLRLLGVVSVAAAVLLTLYTGSRGGLLGLATFLLLFLATGLGRVRVSRRLAILLLLGGVLAMNLEKINIDRYKTLAELGNDYNVSDEYGRAQLWSRGLRLFSRDPLTGVGVGNFAEAIGAMRHDEAGLPVWQTAHNSYLQILGETGAFGAGAFLLLILTSLTTLRWTRARLRAAAAGGLETVPGLLLAGFAGQLVSACFLSQAYSILFTLIFAASVALKRVVESKAMEVPTGA
ncbi:MAG TPA: O-antigen ligase family protein [Vicinamibacterales bacterium]|nr:O-antigen ligase family protein [Vicinamibacterales bacterium]